MLTIDVNCSLSDAVTFCVDEQETQPKPGESFNHKLARLRYRPDSKEKTAVVPNH